MRDLLSRENAGVLTQLAWARVLLAFDFDGTLAPIVTHPDRARMRPRTEVLLREVCRLYPSAVISGRGRADVAARLGGAHVKYVVGNHGLEPGPHMDDFERDIASARAHLEALLGRSPGVDIDDKRYSLAIHYRRSRQRRLTRAAILKAVATVAVPVRTVLGKCVVNVLPARAPNKGDALLGLRAAEHADTALYVGDDVTDEDVFELDQPGRLVTVSVGDSGSSAAAYFLWAQKDMDRLLAKLATLRNGRVRP